MRLHIHYAYTHHGGVNLKPVTFTGLPVYDKINSVPLNPKKKKKK